MASSDHAPSKAPKDSSNTITSPPPSPNVPEPVEDLHRENVEEYGCGYCNKKFSTKQALGGHQNAHKAERSMEKAASEMCTHFAQKNELDFFARITPYHPSNSLPSAFIKPLLTGQALPAGGMNYSSLLGAQVPRISSYPYSAINFQYPVLNSQPPVHEIGSSSTRPPLQNPREVVPSNNAPPTDLGGLRDEEIDEDSDLDLSLKL